jgi:hypothetical protein
LNTRTSGVDISVDISGGNVYLGDIGVDGILKWIVKEKGVWSGLTSSSNGCFVPGFKETKNFLVN